MGDLDVVGLFPRGARVRAVFSRESVDAFAVLGSASAAACLFSHGAVRVAISGGAGRFGDSAVWVIKGDERGSFDSLFLLFFVRFTGLISLSHM